MFGNGFFGGFGGHQDEDWSEENTDQSKADTDTEELYQILNVPQTATDPEIKKAFRQASLKGDYRHPDRGGDVNKFQQLNQAYQILSDPNKRQVYDKYGKDAAMNGGPAGAGGGMGDIFSHIFGGGAGQGGQPKGVSKCKPKGVEMRITLQEAYQGGMKVMEVPRQRICQGCDGKGGKDAQTCPACQGRKMVTQMVMLGPGMYSQTTQPCTDCKGEGTIFDEKHRCTVCKGVKIIDEKKKLEVTIEPGVPDSFQITYTGEGDEIPGAMAGDVIFVVKIEKNQDFERKGADLYINKKIPLLQALTGLNFVITHLDGVKITVTTYPGEVISHGEVQCIKQQGMPFHKDSMSHGNLYIQFNVEFPQKGTFKPDKIEALAQILPGTRIPPLDQSAQCQYLDDFDQGQTNSKAEGGNKQSSGVHGGHDEEEDEQEGGAGGQRGGPGVQCSQQ